jgi:hypothetical protein
LIVPERAIELAGAPRYGWWRVDPATGQALGVMSTGRGQGMAEYGMIACITILAFFCCAGANPGGNSKAKNVACLGCAALAGVAAALVLQVIALGAVGAAIGGKEGLVLSGLCNAISAATS